MTRVWSQLQSKKKKKIISIFGVPSLLTKNSNITKTYFGIKITIDDNINKTENPYLRLCNATKNKRRKCGNSPFCHGCSSDNCKVIEKVRAVFEQVSKVLINIVTSNIWT